MSRPVHAAGPTDAARRLCRFDGRTRVTAVELRGEWRRAPRRTRLTHSLVHELRRHGVQQVELRRRFRRVRVPLRWIPPRTPFERLP